MEVQVVENPRRGKRRKYSAKQRAAGFGGKRSMRGRRSKRRSVRRRNPALAVLSNPRRRRARRTVRGYVQRRRRNPKIMGFAGFDIGTASMVGIGMLGSEMVPTLVRKMWSGLPSTGWMNYGVKLGGTFITAYGVKMVTKSTRNFQLVLAGGLGLILVDLFRQYVAPNIGLAGMGSNGSFVYPSELTDVQGVGGYIDETGQDLGRYVDRNGMAGYVDSPVGAY